jgi:hypothetical protein
MKLTPLLRAIPTENSKFPRVKNFFIKNSAVVSLDVLFVCWFVSIIITNDMEKPVSAVETLANKLAST